MSVCSHPSLSLFILLQVPELKGQSLPTALLACHLKIFQYVSLRTLVSLLLLQHFWYLRNGFLWHRNCQSLMCYEINLTSDWNHISIKKKINLTYNSTHKSNFKQRALLTII